MKDSCSISSDVTVHPTLPKHEVVHVIGRDQEADIDKQIATLIQEMWKAGIETYQSCQDNLAGWVWIQFSSSHGLEKFLNIVGEHEKGVGNLAAAASDRALTRDIVSLYGLHSVTVMEPTG